MSNLTLAEAPIFWQTTSHRCRASFIKYGKIRADSPEKTTVFCPACESIPTVRDRSPASRFSVVTQFVAQSDPPMNLGPLPTTRSNWSMARLLDDELCIYCDTIPRIRPERRGGKTCAVVEVRILRVIRPGVPHGNRIFNVGGRHHYFAAFNPCFGIVELSIVTGYLKSLQISIFILNGESAARVPERAASRHSRAQLRGSRI